MNKNKYYVKVVKYTALHSNRIKPNGLFPTDYMTIFNQNQVIPGTQMFGRKCVAICNLICCIDLTGAIKY